MGAVVSSFHIPTGTHRDESQRDECALVKWCYNLRLLKEQYLRNTTLENLQFYILTNDAEFVRRECPNVQVLPYDEELMEVVTNFGGRQNDNCPPAGLLKWQVMKPWPSLKEKSVLFLDLDVDIIGRRLELLRYSPFSLEKWRTSVLKSVAQFVNGPCAIIASPDHASPLNGGIFAVKQSKKLYRRGLDLLRTGLFNSTHGFNLSFGPPLTIMPNPSKPLARSKMFRANTWDFVCSRADQGLFTAIFLFGDSESYCFPQNNDTKVYHYWAVEKPWRLKKLGRGALKRLGEAKTINISSEPWMIVKQCPEYFDFLRELDGFSTPCSDRMRVIHRVYQNSPQLLNQESQRQRCRAFQPPVF